jgi:integrase
MSRPLNRLSAQFCARIRQSGKYADGGNLYLIVNGVHSKSWAFLYSLGGRRREVGLGGLRSVSLARARELAALARSDVGEGRDPKARRGRRHVVTFGEAADQLLEDISPTWTSAKHRRQWQRSLAVEAAALRSAPVDAITTDMVLAALQPQWLSHPVSAARLRLRIEKVLDYAKARGWRSSSENPARWRGHLQFLLARVPRARPHHAALAYRDIPEFWAQLVAVDTGGSRALRFLILTAARAGEALGARWQEIDLDAAVWEVPAGRMKGRRAHRVPLSEPALVILRELFDLRTGAYVFPSPHRHGQPIGGSVLVHVLRRPPLSLRITVHGFRSSFRDWCGDCTSYSREVAEAALAHTVGNQVERAYRRGDSFDQRRQLMDSWSAYVTGEGSAKVIALRK